MTPRIREHEAEKTAAPELPAANVPFNWALLGTLKDGGIVIVLVWYLWFSTTTTLPSMQEKFHDVVKAEREAFRAEMQAQRAFEEKRHADQTQAVRDLGREIVQELRRGRKE